MSKIKIDNEVPIPERRRTGRAKGESKYPFKDMNVGDSFLVPVRVKKVSAYQVAHRGERMTGFKFSTRADESGRIRVWRVA